MFLRRPDWITVRVVCPRWYNDHRRLHVLQIRTELILLLARVEGSRNAMLFCYCKVNTDKFN